MDRIKYWIDFVNARRITRLAEIGVWRGEFAEALLQNCPAITDYYLIDPWQKLDDWNKPLNEDNLDEALEETRRRLAPFKAKCHYLRGRTQDMAGQLPELDFAYIDGDHTLRGIMIDLVKIWPRIRAGGWLGGDDLAPSIWQHKHRYEPSLVFPTAVHFAEALDCPITAPGMSQFVIEKSEDGFVFNDATGAYPTTDLRPHVRPSSLTRWLFKR